MVTPEWFAPRRNQHAYVHTSQLSFFLSTLREPLSNKRRLNRDQEAGRP